MNEAIKNTIEDVRCLLEEAQESGDLEERLLLSEKLAQLESTLTEHEKDNTEAQFHECGLCHGAGKHEEYREEWDCQSCLGIGGWFS